MKVSFIIPVYNVENYIHQCVDSIITQTYRDIEIILVDDGSPDGSPKICDEYAAKDPRIIALHKTNGGLSDARNYGLNKATGDYVAFVDSDDFWASKDALEMLVTILSNNKDVDFIGFNCQYYFQRNEHYVKWPLYPEVLKTPTDKNSALVELSKAGIFPVSACMKLIKRDFLVEKKIFFKIGQLSEDIPWFVNLMDSSNECMFINEYIYSYRQVDNGSSISHSIGVRNIDNVINIINKEIELIDKRSFNHEAKDAIYSFMAYELAILYACLQFLSKEDALIRYKKLNELRWLFSYTKNPKVKKIYLFNKFLGTRITVMLLQRFLNHVR